MTRPNLEQGVGGVHGTRPTTKGTDQAPGAERPHPRNPNRGGKLSPALEGRMDNGTNTSSTGDNLTPFRPTTNQPSPVKGGGTVIGHDRVNPNAGKAFSGPKFAVKNLKQVVSKELTNPGRKQTVAKNSSF